MTREELNLIEKDYWEEKADPIDMTEVFDLASKAIEQEPTVAENATTEQFGNSEELGTTKQNLAVEAQEPCEDCASVLNRVMEYTYGMLTAEKAGLQHFIKSMLDELPPVKPQEPKTETVTEFADRCKECGTKYGRLLKQEPKTGHWIYKDYNWYCSECGETPKTLGYVGNAAFMRKHFKFCNHCGCRMESEG